MKDEFQKYIIDLYQDIPSGVYEGLLSTFCFGVVLMLAFCGIKKGLKYSIGLLLTEYVFIIFCSTVFFRQSAESQGHVFTPFWSYSKPELMEEIIMNVVVFVPVGILLGFMIQGARFSRLASSNERQVRGTVRHGLLIVLAIGLCISGSIEAMQYFLKRGFSEVDDVMHNTLGCLIGFGLFSLLRISYERLTKKDMPVL